MKTWVRIVGVTVLGAAAAAPLAGCASKKYVEERVGEQSARIEGVESSLEESQRRIRDVGERVGQVDFKAGRAQETGSQALETGTRAFAVAEQAQRLARGKLVLEATIDDDVAEFKIDRWELPEGAGAELDHLVQEILAMDRRVYLEIQGHTDSTGPESWNQELGERRAEQVRRHLSDLGVPLFAMSVISYGDAQPVDDNATAAGRARNRRVVVRVLEEPDAGEAAARLDDQAVSRVPSPPGGSP